MPQQSMTNRLPAFQRKMHFVEHHVDSLAPCHPLNPSREADIHSAISECMWDILDQHSPRVAEVRQDCIDLRATG